MTHDILEQLPSILPREEDSVIARYINAHSDEFEVIDERNQFALEAHQIDNATDDELDRLGALFGQLGRRRGRNDSDYREYLKGIANSFKGRGSVEGVKFAVAAAADTDPSNVRLIEDFQNLEYSLQIEDADAANITQSVNDLAELADPSVVLLDEAILLIGDGTAVADGNGVTTTTEVGLGGGTLDLDGTKQLG